MPAGRWRGLRHARDRRLQVGAGLDGLALVQLVDGAGSEGELQPAEQGSAAAPIEAHGIEAGSEIEQELMRLGRRRALWQSDESWWMGGAGFHGAYQPENSKSNSVRRAVALM